MSRTPATVATAVLAAAALAGCTGPVRPAARGVVTGTVAAPCPATPPSITSAKALPTPGTATVTVQHHGHVVASQVVRFSRGAAHYRLSLPPGRYLINGPQPAHRPVVVRAGTTVTVNL